MLVLGIIVLSIIVLGVIVLGVGLLGLIFDIVTRLRKFIEGAIITAVVNRRGGYGRQMLVLDGWRRIRNMNNDLIGGSSSIAVFVRCWWRRVAVVDRDA